MTKPCGHEDWETMPDGSCALADCGVDTLATLKGEKIQLTLTLGEIDELFKAGQMHLERSHELVSLRMTPETEDALESALQKLDEAVNG